MVNDLSTVHALKNNKIEDFDFGFFYLYCINVSVATLRPGRGLRLTSYSSFNLHHLWLLFLDASCRSRYVTELTAAKANTPFCEKIWPIRALETVTKGRFCAS